MNYLSRIVLNVTNPAVALGFSQKSANSASPSSPDLVAPCVPTPTLSRRANRDTQDQDTYMPSNAGYKVHIQEILAGTGNADAILVNDDDGDELSLEIINSYRSDQRQSLRRSHAHTQPPEPRRKKTPTQHAITDEEERLLGPDQPRGHGRIEEARGRISKSCRSFPTDAVLIHDPSSPKSEMVERGRQHFLVDAGLRPVNTLHSVAPVGKSALIHQTRQRGVQHADISKQSSGEPLKKKQKLSIDHIRHIRSDDSTHTQTPEKNSARMKADLVKSHGFTSDSPKTPAPHAVKTTPLRTLRTSPIIASSPDVLMNDERTQVFTTSATRERRAHAFRESKSKKPAITPKNSRMRARLTSTSSDELQSVEISPISAPDPDSSPTASFTLDRFIIRDYVDDSAYLDLHHTHLSVRYCRPQISTDAIMNIKYRSITKITYSENEIDPIVMLHLRGGTVPTNLLFFVFGLENPVTDFITFLVSLKIKVQLDPQTGKVLSNALGYALVHSADVTPKGQMNPNKQRRIESPPKSTTTTCESRPRRQTLYQDLDRPPEQPIAKPGNQSDKGQLPRPESASSVARPRRKRSDSFHDFDADTANDPNADAGFRRQGPRWESTLRYPSDAPRKETLEWDDLERLEDNQYLNDSIIGLFLRYIQENAKEDYPPRVHFMNSFFFETLARPADKKSTRRQINYSAVERWTKNVNLFARSFVVVPVNETEHWYTLLICNLDHFHKTKEEDAVTSENIQMPAVREPELDIDKSILRSDVVADAEMNEITQAKINERNSKRKPVRPRRKYSVQEPVIVTLDSLDIGGRFGAASMLKDYVVCEAQSKHRLNIDKSTIKGMTGKGLPQQENGTDCGLYMCLYLEQFMCNPSKFAQFILSRDETAFTWPNRITGSKLRQRLYDFLQSLYAMQIGAPHNPIPELGKILIRDEDYVHAEPQVRTRNQPTIVSDLDRMKNGLDYIDNHYERSALLSDGCQSTDRGQRSNTSAKCHTGESRYEPPLEGIEQYARMMNQPVVIIDDSQSSVGHDNNKSSHLRASESGSNTSKYFNQSEDPAQMAKEMEQARTQLREQPRRTEVIDLSSPVKSKSPQKQEAIDYGSRGRSVSTEFLSGSASYVVDPQDQATDDDTRREEHINTSQKQHRRYRSHTNGSERGRHSDLVLSCDGQPDGTDIAQKIMKRVRSDREVSLIPDSINGDQTSDKGADLPPFEDLSEHMLL